MSDDPSRIDRARNYGLMIAGHSAVTHAVRSLDAALFSVEQAARSGTLTNGPVVKMATIEADLREILARVEAVNARHPAETKEAA
ncbi:hypothetical protein [Methylorubrum extorquens]|uniref:Uncharacterized protein n=1 Tax=Methylorubrum extorquens DSM 13060 TaxID=882800 RepID=H1KCA6_METEX|nr:hypothetical protein [Methylorubrum extorquens]EHP94923.1 hypothetical protein MetexDRAFT_0268 [Methylorubrum extorquens DSM 13060]